MKNAFILRAVDRASVVVLMRGSLAVVQAELDTPLTQEQFISAQAIHALAPVAADVELGPYDMERTRFTGCSLAFDPLPVVQHRRLDYTQRRQNKKCG